jgi:hypothetical protein
MNNYLMYFIVLLFMFNSTKEYNASRTLKSIVWSMSTIKVLLWTILWIVFCYLKG